MPSSPPEGPIGSCADSPMRRRVCGLRPRYCRAPGGRRSDDAGSLGSELSRWTRTRNCSRNPEAGTVVSQRGARDPGGGTNHSPPGSFTRRASAPRDRTMPLWQFRPAPEPATGIPAQVVGASAHITRRPTHACSRWPTECTPSPKRHSPTSASTTPGSLAQCFQPPSKERRDRADRICARARRAVSEQQPPEVAGGCLRAARFPKPHDPRSRR